MGSNPKRAVALGVILVLAIGGCGGTADPVAKSGATATTSATAAPSAGRIVYRRFLDGSETQGALYTSDTDGSHEKQLTDPGAGVVDDEPNWSPDGSRVVFSRNTATGTDHEQQAIYVIAADGSGLTALSPKRAGASTQTFLSGADQGPAFSPDGQHIAFTHIGGHVAFGPAHGLPPGTDQIEFSEIFVMDADGSHRRQVTRHAAYSGDSGTGVAWSPDGSRLVYSHFSSPAASPAGCRSLFVVDVDGQHSRELTPCALGAGGAPDWSAADVIVFRAVVDDESGIGNFFSMSPQGGSPTPVTHFTDTVISHKIGFSPDGRRIVFSTAKGGGANDLFTADLDGSHLQRLTHTPQADSAPDWGPER